MQTHCSNNRDSNKIFANICHHIDDATSVMDLTPFLNVIPLDLIKQCLKQRIQSLRNVISNSQNGIHNPMCSIQYNEMRKLAMSISPITDILSNDVITHIISFLTSQSGMPIHHRSKETIRYLKFLPVLSSTFQCIMHSSFFYHSKFSLHIHDTEVRKQVSKRKKTKQSNGDPFDIHIYADHTLQRLEIKHLKTQNNIKSTKTIKKVPRLKPNKALDSLLPWKNRNTLFIEGNITNSKNTNPNILNILLQTNPKCLCLRGTIPGFRLKSYSPFTSVILLDLGDCDCNKLWLNNTHFPQLKVLIMSIPSHMTSNAVNKLINSFNLRALHLTDGPSRNKLELNISSSELQFLCLGKTRSKFDYVYRSHIDSDLTQFEFNNFVKTLNISKCTALIGVHCSDQIPFKSIKWNRKCPLTFINVSIEHSERESEYANEWYNAYTNEQIQSEIVIGHCFFNTEPKVKDFRTECNGNGMGFGRKWKEFIEDETDINNSENKYVRRRSMKFEQILNYIANHSNIERNIAFYQNSLFDRVFFLLKIGKNFPPWMW